MVNATQKMQTFAERVKLPEPRLESAVSIEQTLRQTGSENHERRSGSSLWQGGGVGWLFFIWPLGLRDWVWAAHPPAEIEVFVRPGCPYCAAAERFLQDLQSRQPGLQVRRRDISQDPEAFQELSELAHGFGIQPLRVPAFYLRGQLII